jgi:hypothetical protein
MYSQLFPLQDATLYSLYPQTNTGLDPILELTKPNGENASRILIQFDQEEITSILNQISTTKTTGSWEAYLRLYASEVENLPTIVPIVVNPVSQEWDQGTGKLADSPTTKNGASWVGPKTGSLWNPNNISSLYYIPDYSLEGYVGPVALTGSYLSGSIGGGSWYLSSYATTSISQYTPQDLWINVTSIVNNWSSSLIPNNGFIIRVSESVENNPNYDYKLSYFSRDTNTIFSPSLFFYWNTQEWDPNLTKLQINQVFDVAIGNNDGIYYPESNVRFTVASRDKYPQRQFVTQSLYEFNKTLPSQSYYQIVDVDTNEAVIPFNNPGTLISANKAGSYFRVDMNTLEPERYYTVQVKVNIDGSTYVKSQTDMKFKVSQTV